MKSKYIQALSLALFLVAGHAYAGDESPSQGIEAPVLLNEVAEAIQSGLLEIDAQMAESVRELPGESLVGAKARDTLRRLYAGQSYVADVATVSSSGVLLSVEPPSHSQAEGKDISSQLHFRRLQATKAPVLSRMFKAVEGFPAVAIQHPLLDSEGRLEGELSMLIHHDELIDSIATPRIQDTPFELWVMQTDGTILYDADAEEIGRNLFGDPIYLPYPDLQTLGKVIAEQPAGRGTYNFPPSGGGESILKQAYWSSVALHGTQWRVVVTHEQTTGP